MPEESLPEEPEVVETTPSVFERPQVFPRVYTWADVDLPQQYWWIYPGGFLDRLGVNGLAIAGSDHPVCKAAQGQFQNRLYIDLKSPKLAQVLALLMATGQPAVSVYFPGAAPITQTDIDAYLAPPTTDYERFVKGLTDPTE